MKEILPVTKNPGRFSTVPPTEARSPQIEASCPVLFALASGSGGVLPPFLHARHGRFENITRVKLDIEGANGNGNGRRIGELLFKKSLII